MQKPGSVKQKGAHLPNACQYRMKSFVTANSLELERGFMIQKNSWKLGVCLTVGLTLLSCAHNRQAKAPTASETAPAATTDAGITDNEIRDVVNRVAHHQLRPLKD